MKAAAWLSQFSGDQLVKGLILRHRRRTSHIRCTLLDLGKKRPKKKAHSFVLVIKILKKKTATVWLSQLIGLQLDK